MKVTIWIRVEDKDKWLAIKNRPEFIHNALNPVKTINTKEDALKVAEKIVPHKNYLKKS